MAKLHNTKYATFDESVWGNKREVKVGNNRVLGFDKFNNGQKVLGFALHHSTVAALELHTDGTKLLCLSAEGWHTVTTREAINDALSLFGIAGSASTAKGTLSARLYIDGEWQEFTEDEYGYIVVNLGKKEGTNV